MYYSDSEIIESCLSVSTEYLYFESNKILRGTYNACDRTGLEFLRTE